ncbi:F-box only protein 31-like [Montipora foliosa]|uniref:F-box only protein 31-like n=1 Tax=Montipora foliosa TaxID=591990 RepID=UPI0035F20885
MQDGRSRMSSLCSLGRPRKMSKVAEVFYLANELLASIFKHLNGFELCTVARTCRRFRDASHIEEIWQHLCDRDYGASSLRQWPEGTTYRDLYINVLHKYGYLLGLWKCDVNPYGGLVYIEIVQGGIDAFDCRAPLDPDITSVLRRRRIFSIRIEEGKSVVLCYSSWDDTPHYATLHKEKIDGKKVVRFYLQCSNQERHEFPREREKGMQFLRRWMKDEYDNENLLFYQPHMIQLVLMKYVNMHSMHRMPIDFEALELPQQTDEELVIKPGIFKGTYSSHGVELVMVTFSSAEDKILGIKITGDPNVPEGKLTFEVDLRRPVIEELPVSEGQQRPFELPNVIEARFTDFPPFYQAKYHGAGQIASHGFLSPRMTPGVFVLFNDDLFGFLWSDLMAFSVYSRANEPYLR